MKARVKKFNDGRKSPWGVVWYVDRERQLRFFATRSQADSFAGDLNRTFSAGADPEKVTRALQAVAGTGIAIDDAVYAGLQAIRAKSRVDQLSTMTVDEAIDAVMRRTIAKGRRTKTIESYQGQFACIRRDLGGGRVLAAMADSEIEDYLARLTNNQREIGKASPRTKETMLTMVRILAKEAGIPNPFPSIELPTQEVANIEYFSPEEVRFLFRHAYPDDRGMLAAAIFGAMRPTRLGEFSPDDFRPDEQSILTGLDFSSHPER